MAIMAKAPPQDSDRRSAILDAALAAFTERGYGSTTMSQVRRASGASTGSLYHHFPDRAHLAATIWVDGLARFQSGFVDSLETADAAESGVRAGVAFHVQWVTDHRALAQFLLTDHDPDVVDAAAHRRAALNDQFFPSVLRWHRRHVDAGAMRPMPFDLLHALWMAPSQELTRTWLAGRASCDPHAFSDELATAAWNALRTELPRVHR